MKPKILIALFRMPYPATDGTRYKILDNVSRGLMRDFDIEFFIVNIKKYSKSDVEFLEKNYGTVHLFHHSKIAYGWNAAPAFFSGLPLQARAFMFPDAKRWLDANIQKYDAVYIHEIRMTEFFIGYPDDMKKKFLVDFNDAISMNYRAGWKRMRFPENLFYRWEGERVANYESKVLESFQHFNIVSETDKRYLLNAPTYHGGCEIDFSCIPHGVTLSPEPALLDQDKIFFMGSLDYEPNRDALMHFLKTVWPKLQERVPSVELLVIGGGHLGELRATKGVSLLGFVPNVFDAVRHCKAMIAPIRFAGGMPSKIVEAMAYGIPVVATPSGVAGIAAAKHDANIVIVPESDAEEWISAIGKVLNDKEYRETLAKNARELIGGHYSSDASQEKFRKLFRGIVNN